MSKPVAGVEIGLVEGVLTVNPTKAEMAKSSLQLTVAGTVLHCTVVHCTALYCTALCCVCTMLLSNMLLCPVLHYITLYCALYYTVL
jgi:3' exoribonuclease family, domain 2